ncbi:MAG: histidine phosphatase family protein [Anaerolineales bacterium]|nr:histidine phosphatase family protein [Anaerolineales bacterium]
MKTLLVLRHAKSSWSNDYLADHERPLNDRGKQDAPRMGRLLQAEDLTPDLIISSSAERALTTAELVALNCGYDNEIAVTRRFYHADAEDYLAVLGEVDDAYEQVMVVGHNPGMEELVEDLTGESVRMATAGLAYLQLDIDSWRDLTLDTLAKLQALWLPKEL